MHAHLPSHRRHRRGLWVLSVCGEIDLPDFDTSTNTTRAARTTRAPTTTVAVETDAEYLDATFELALATFEVNPLYPVEAAKELALAVCAEVGLWIDP